jgi:hypothetical protein
MTFSDLSVLSLERGILIESPPTPHWLRGERGTLLPPRSKVNDFSGIQRNKKSSVERGIERGNGLKIRSISTLNISYTSAQIDRYLLSTYASGISHREAFT